MKKQIPLRIAPQLYDELERWAEEDFRSVNSQIEYILTECVKCRNNGKQKVLADEINAKMAICQSTENCSEKEIIRKAVAEDDNI